MVRLSYRVRGIMMNVESKIGWQAIAGVLGISSALCSNQGMDALVASPGISSGLRS